MHLPHPQRTRAGALKALLIVAALLVSGLVLTGVALARSLRVPPHSFPDFHEEVIRKLDLKIRSSVEVNPPPLVFALARLVSHCVEVEPEARHAMRAVRAAQVGVYELTESPNRQTQSSLIAIADTRCAALGWQRAACVMDRHDLVLVYFSDKSPKQEEVEVFVMALDERDLVAVGACGDARSLSKVVSAALNHHGRDLLAGLR